MDNYKKVERAIQQGDLWRAKEILRGRVGNTGYDPELFEKYGVLLLRTGDAYEAGKFLFLSGVRNTEYAQALQVFVGRYKQRKPDRLLHAIPKHIRKADIAQWPKSTVEELAALGIALPSFQRGQKDISAINKSTERRHKLFGYVLLTIAILATVTFIVGVVTGLKTIWGWLF